MVAPPLPKGVRNSVAAGRRAPNRSPREGAYTRTARPRCMARAGARVADDLSASAGQAQLESVDYWPMAILFLEDIRG